MKILAIAASVFIALAAIAFPARAYVEQMPIMPQQGNAPLRVTIAGPQTLLKMIAACKYRQGWITPSFHIDWGDGRNDPAYFAPGKEGQSCADVKNHTYTVPGTYRVQVRISHLGPTDAPVTDWQGENTIVVGGQATENSAKIEISNINEGQTFTYQGLPVVDWSLTTNQNVNVTTELLAADGVVIDRQTQEGIAYSGPGKSMINQTGDSYNDALSRKALPFILRISVVKDGAVLARAERHVTMKSEFRSIGSGVQVTPITGKAPLSVGLQYSYFHSACFSYRVDWGDGSAPDAQQQTPPPQGCLLDGGVLKLSHIYAKPGNYEIRLHSTNSNPFQKLDAVVPYESARVRVSP